MSDHSTPLAPGELIGPAVAAIEDELSAIIEVALMLGGTLLALWLGWRFFRNLLSEAGGAWGGCQGYYCGCARCDGEMDDRASGSKDW